MSHSCRQAIFLFVLVFMSLVDIFFSQLSYANTLEVKPSSHISYTDAGKGKPVILIHAYPFDQRLWKPQQDGLKQYFRVITLDLWGFGKSSPVTGKTVEMDEYASEIKQLLDDLHIKKAIIGGESMGGYISLAFLKHYPERVEGLILSDTDSISDPPDIKAQELKTADDILANGPTQFINDFLPIAISPYASSQIHKYVLDIMNEQTSAVMSAAFRGIANRYDTSDVLSKTLLPILIITGDQDKVISPQESQHMHALAKRSRLVIIAGAGHLPSLEKPEEWNKAVIKMFKS